MLCVSIYGGHSAVYDPAVFRARWVRDGMGWDGHGQSRTTLNVAGLIAALQDVSLSGTVVTAMIL